MEGIGLDTSMSVVLGMLIHQVLGNHRVMQFSAQDNLPEYHRHYQGMDSNQVHQTHQVPMGNSALLQGY